jgi:putative addiction module component (TIGR02574 family)
MTSALEQFRQWPVDEQIEFVHRAWDEIAESSWQPQLTAEQKAELDRRLAAYHAAPANVLTWEQVVAHLGRPR